MVLRVLEQGWSIKAAAAAAETSPRTCGKWVARYRHGREFALLDRSSAPRVVANRTDERRIEAIAALRRLRFTGPEIAELLAMPLSTVSGILTRIGMGRLGRLGLEPAERYERERPGELIHIDVKKLGRIHNGPGHRITGSRRNQRRTTYTADGRRVGDAGWDFVHIAIDDCTRLAYAEVLPDERPAPPAAFSPERSASTAATGSPSSACSPTTARPTAQPFTRSPAARSASATCAHDRDARRPTARPNAPSAPCSPAGPTARSTTPTENAPQPLTGGSGPTTIAADTQPSAANHPSAG
jgi:hypothetical protein